jgi:arachidonate 15-lipoxygenase
MSGFAARVWNSVCDWVSPLKVAIPQNGGFNAVRRRQRGLEFDREDYRFNYTHVSTLAVADTLPIREELHFGWLFEVCEKVLVSLDNRASINYGSEAARLHREKRAKLHSLKLRGLAAVAEIRDLVRAALLFDVRIGASNSPAKTVEEYNDLFRAIGLPAISKDFGNDLAFANMRVGGPNPMMLKRMTAPDDRLPVTEALYRAVVPGDSLAAAMAEARLYVTDYAVLDGVETGSFPNGQKYISAPIALFVVDKATKMLKPVAIQLKQKPGPDNPIFTPGDGWNWQIAKTFVEVADGNVHETVMHFARTHMVMEPFVLCTFRQLAANHPIRLLLAPHFEGTLNINTSSWKHLIADGGAIDKLCAPSIQACRGLAIQGVKQIDVMASLLPKTFADRGVDDASALPNYPYRDDAMMYWKIIGEWVAGYTALYYTGDADVQDDPELQAWVRELAANDGGRIAGLPNGGTLRTLGELNELLTYTLFTCSAQHAAVNFPQYPLMSYTPNMPLAAYRPVPTAKTGATEADYIAMLPTLDMAELQTELGYMLGDVYYTELGQYSHNQFRHDPRVDGLLQTFHTSVANAGTTIAERNEERPFPYTTLLPEGIPQSINI